MRFVFAMAWREIRSSWRRLFLFFACLALGVGAMVSLRSFTRVFSDSIVRDARTLLGADVRVESREPWTPPAREILTRHAAGSALASTTMLEIETMVRTEIAGPARPLLAAVRGVEAAFPLRGTVRLEHGSYDYAMLDDRGILVSRSLLERLQRRLGDRVLIGGVPFTIRDVILRLPGNSLNFALVPRVVMRGDDLRSLGLTGFGSRATYAWMFNTADGRERELARAIGDDYRRGRVSGSISTYHYTENWLKQGLANIDGTLSLIGLSLVVLGGIGIASVTRVFIQQRVRTVAILKCLGGRTRRVLGAYLVQIVLLSLAGGVLGLLVAQAITTGLADTASRLLPLDVEPRLAARACVQGVLISLLVSLLFALPPLLNIRDVKPVLVLRQEAPPRRRIDLLKVTVQLLITSALVGVAVWQSGDWRDTGIFVAGIAATAIVLQGAATLLMTALGRLRRAGTFAVRQGIRSLYRPGNQTRVTLFTVGLGALFVTSVRLFQVNVQQEYSVDLTTLSADMFLIDVGPGQQGAVGETLQRLGARDLLLMPMSRGRLVEVRRASPNAAPVGRTQLGGEYRLTSQAALDVSETLDEGQFWTATSPAQPEISVDRGYADWLALTLGDVLVFDVAGRRVEAPVTSVRKYDRRIRRFSSLVRTHFIFRPGVLETLPHSFVGAARGPTDLPTRARLQNEFTAAFPSVTFIDALDQIQEIRTVINNVSLAVSLIGGFVLACGILILAGSIAMTRAQRLYEAAIFRTLGAKTRLLVRITIVEYAILGLLAGTIGSLASIAVTWAASRFGARPIPWALHPWINLTGALATAALVVCVGVLATIGVLMRKPASVLREM